MASGPRTKDTTTVTLGLAQVRLGASAANIDSTVVVLTSANSVGALANTKFTSMVDFFTLESGYPLTKDASFPLREQAKMEVATKEITPQNLAWARGLDASTGYSSAHSGEIALGNMVAPAYVRMESVYTYPDGTNALNIIFPRAQVASGIELDFQAEDNAASPLVIEANTADSSLTSGGSAQWDNRPLGRLYWTGT
jgi:hypothetical protein